MIRGWRDLCGTQVDEDRIEAVESELPEGTGEDDSSRKKIEALADIICNGAKNLRRHCSCSWKRCKRRLNPKHSRTLSSILLLLAVVS